jgi:hypothetical protein
MISIDNQSLNCVATDQDFTVDSYRHLIRLAVGNYEQANYRSIPWGRRFVLWRHDCDYSLNRSLALAKVEAEEGLRSAFFVNPHCEFYNLLERDQLALIKEIAQFGHEIGLHFDASFYNTATEDELHEQVAGEANLLELLVGIRPVAFSFHNPSAFHLTCESETYGGLVNCYSKRFKTEVPYCSDSNGYWRFRRLFDVLSAAKDPCLQVLTHPGWWQKKPMPPRQRIFRAVYGRASALMSRNDKLLEVMGRDNLAGAARGIMFLKPINSKLYDHCDYFWNTEQFQTLFIELWRLHARQLKQLCKAMFHRKWHVSSGEAKIFFESDTCPTDGWRLFSLVFGASPAEASGSPEDAHTEWAMVLDKLLRGGVDISGGELEEVCVSLCGAMEGLAKWGVAQESIGYDGISDVGEINIPTDSGVQGERERLDKVKDSAVPPDNAWNEFLRSTKSATSKLV